MSRGHKRKGGGGDQPSPIKRARGKTQDLNRLWKTPVGSDAIPFTPGNASLLSGSLLGLGSNSMAWSTPIFGQLPASRDGRGGALTY